MKGVVGKAIVTVLFGILIVSFAIWGIQDIFRNGVRSDTVAEVGNTEISGTAFLNEFQRELKSYQQQLGPQFTAQTAMAAGLDTKVLERMINRTAFDETAYNMGIRVSDKQVANYIRQQPVFTDQAGGGFNRLQYQALLQQVGLTEQQYESQTRYDIARGYLIDALIGGREAPKSLVDALYKYRNQTRVVDLAYLPNDTISDVPTPDDDAVQSYYKDHIARFTAPEYRQLSYIALGPATLMSEVEVTDKDMHDLYDSRKNEYMPGEKRTLEAMNFFDQAAAEKASNAVKGGEDFAKAAKEFGASNADDLSIGKLTQVDLETKLGKDVALEAFSVPVNTATKPVKNVFGNWSVVEATATTAGLGKTFDEVKDALHKEIATEKASDALYGMLSKIEDDLAGGANLKEVADKFNLEVKKVADIDRQGDAPDGTRVEGLPQSRKFLDYSFNARPGDDLELTDGGDNLYFIIKVDGVTPSTPKPLDKVRPQVVSAWQAEKRRDMAQERAKKLVDWADKEKNLATVATTAGGKVTTSDPLLRDGSVSQNNVTPALLAQIFDTKQGSAGWGAAPDGKGYILFKVKDVTTPDPAANPDPVKKVDAMVTENMANDLLAEYQAFLSKDLGVKVHNEVVKSTLSQLSTTQ
jgi:peptidyl-prolyl cis-trans isomerase D